MPTRTELIAREMTSRDVLTVILLAGRVGQNPLAEGIQRSALDLPVARGRRILDVWAERFAELSETEGFPGLVVRIAVDQDGAAPLLPAPSAEARVRFEVVRDAAEYRGTAGVVKDLTRDLDDADRILVASANQIQLEPLGAVVADLLAAGEGVSMVPRGASELAGAFLLRRERLRAVPDVGFVDLKEQAIPDAVGAGHLVVSRRPRGSSLPVRTLDEYVAALRWLHAPGGPAASLAEPENPFAESWQPRFAIVEEGADVAESAVLQDTVVLAGGRVEPDAVVARAVVCPGGFVRRGETIVETVVRA